jgi:hypothetical protein
MGEASGGLAPFVLRFRSPITLTADNPFADLGTIFDRERLIWLDSCGLPLWAARTQRPQTACMTAGHMVKSGYTKTGYKPAKFVSPKTDYRAGK